MQIFLDTADIDDIRKWSTLGIINGVTTNPKHLSSIKGATPCERVVEICALMGDRYVSVQVTEHEPEAVYKQAHRIAAIASNVMVKIPCHVMYYSVIERLVSDGIRLNITLVFTIIQALMMAKLGVYCISLFIGRLDEVSDNGLEVLHEMCLMMDEYGFKTQILVASIRDIEAFEGAVIMGAHIATVSVDILEQSLQNRLTDKGMVAFDISYKRAGVKFF